MSKANSGWKKVGTLMKNKDNTKDNYIKIDSDITLTAGSFLQVQDPRKKLKEAVAAGRIDAAKGEELLAKIPDFVLREVVQAPPRK
jgi:hypothetical protein